MTAGDDDGYRRPTTPNRDRDAVRAFVRRGEAVDAFEAGLREQVDPLVARLKMADE